MRKVVVIEPGYLDYEEEEKVLRAHQARFVSLPIGIDRSEILKEVVDADAIMVREAVVDAEILDAAVKCKVVVRYGVGVDNIDLSYAKQKGIYVANVPDYGSEDVAEHALTLLLAATRRIVTRDKDVHQGRWGIGQAEPIPRLGGKVLGVIGFGRIARSFAQKASGIGFRSTMVFDPALTLEQAKEAGVQKVDLETLVCESDFISLHAPLNEHTRHMINGDLIGKMKPMAVLVNTSRGGLVDEQALYEALQANRIHAAGVDVFETEPVPRDNPLLTLPNAICTDHTAWFTEESVVELQHKGAVEVLRVFDGETPNNWVNQ
ncbi:4-phosphoerythronate dehydrogenase [Vibrio natriegens]|jgi:D-3-phosphoglycerate dehydrogenase|uniref:C-terminal binding protein n=1 Tax=Vibrio natriegens TaxID=691 RepID=UPI000803F248|nr:C-terminal binding protein [Vibrio natriegens]ANQ23807.1 4-phosphoerythronate dehydrogenase [Vibrio natriegens]MCY9876961.1 C-terminal binding protein [Vibrio natriegens]